MDHTGIVPVNLANVLDTLKEHEAELHKLGVLHASMFGSVSRGQAHPESDIDVLIDLDPERPIGVFQYARLKLYINELLDGAGDVVNRRKLKPMLRDNILRESVNAF
jgi:predicted nucleotidyltransferase